MLLRINIKNFCSFYEESSFDMFPNQKRTTFPNHIYLNNKIPLLKQAVIYGGNGSGKSNLLNAFSFVKKFVTQKNFINESLIKKHKYRLLNKINSEAIEFKIEFKHQQNYYIYEIHINTELIKERLFLSGLGQEENKMLFERNNNNLELAKQNSSEVSKATQELLKKNKYSSILSLNSEFPILNDKNIDGAYYWFKENLISLSLNRFFPSLITLMSENNEILNFANNIFTKIGLGIEKLRVKTEKIDEYVEDSLDNEILKKLFGEKRANSSGIAGMENDKLLFAIMTENEEQVIKKFVFEQLGIHSSRTDMDISDQSDGTVKILNLIPALYDVITNEKVICIDEIENSIHPSLIFALISFFGNSNSKGQLIFSTHETELLNQQKLMRPDEVWFTEKNNGSTKLYSLNDFKEHNTINIKNGYLDGRYGAIPFIGELS